MSPRTASKLVLKIAVEYFVKTPEPSRPKDSLPLSTLIFNIINLATDSRSKLPLRLAPRRLLK